MTLDQPRSPTAVWHDGVSIERDVLDALGTQGTEVPELARAWVAAINRDPIRRSMNRWAGNPSSACSALETVEVGGNSMTVLASYSFHRARIYLGRMGN